MTTFFEKLIKDTPKEIEEFIDISMDISDQINGILKLKGLKQIELAKMLNKSESEISKFLSGRHNFTLMSLAKISAVLNEKIIVTPMFWNEYEGAYSNLENKTSFISIHSVQRQTSNNQNALNKDDFKDILSSGETLMKERNPFSRSIAS